MKCNQCNSEWQPPRNIVSMFCPFCQTSLIDVNEVFTDLDSVLNFLKTKFGTEVLHNKANVLLFLEKFFPSGKREYNFISHLFASGYVDTLLRLKISPPAIQKSAIKQIVNQFAAQYGISEEWAEYIVGCVCNFIGLSNNVSQSIVKIKQAAENGDSDAQFELAKCYCYGKGVQRNQEKYLEWLKKAADNGLTNAMVMLGEEYLNGVKCPMDMESATFYLKTAALENYSAAICLIASSEKLQELCLIDISNKLSVILEDKESLTSRQLIQISMYYRTRSISTALSLAATAYKKDAKSAWKFYVDVLNESNTHESHVLSHKVIKEMANEGNIEACMLLAIRYESAAKSDNDIVNAIYWYRIAAEAGEVNAQLKLAEIYENGPFIKKNIYEAISWYKIASMNGSEIAKKKTSYKSAECIIKTLTIYFEDDTELECKVIRYVAYFENDYLIIQEPDTKYYRVLKFTETNDFNGIEIEDVDEKTEDIILRKFGGAKI